MNKENIINLTWIKVFIKVFIALTLIIGILTSWIMMREAKIHRQLIISRAEKSLALEGYVFNAILANNVRNVSFLRELTTHILEKSDVSNAEKMASIQRTFYLFAKVHPEYDQERYINGNGNEIIRINNRHGTPFVVPKKMRQNKNKRPYFYNTMQLPKNNIYLSPIEANVEYGKVEIPIIPVMRIATPININNKNIAIVIINYNFRSYIEALRKSTIKQYGTPILTNGAGYFILGPTKNMEWGNVIAERKNMTMLKLFPEAWKNITQGDKEIITIRSGVMIAKNLSTSISKQIPELFSRNINHSLILYIPNTKLKMSVFFYFGIPFTLLLFTLLISALWTAFRTKKIAYDMQMKKLATIDPLTQVANRNKLFETIAREIKRSRRYGTDLTLLMMDIDLFKEVNDKYGHAAGDRVLQELTKACVELIRGTDVIGRFGGEEFITVLPETSLTDALVLAERIRKKVAGLVVAYMNEKIKFTISIGAASFFEDDEEQTLLKRVDDALYAAKKQGRNRVVSADNL